MIPLQAALQPSLTIDEIRLDPVAPEVRIRASRSGCLVQLLGQSADQCMTLNSLGFLMETTGPNVQARVHIPTAHVAATVFVQSRPVGLLVLGILLLPILIGILFIILYFFARRNAVVGVVADAGITESMRLKATPDQVEQLKKALDLMESLLRTSRAVGQTTTCPACAATVPLTASSAGKKITCPTCGQGFAAP